MADQSLPDVRPGQIWADNDARSAGRTLRVDAIDGDKAVCTLLTNSNETQYVLDAAAKLVQGGRAAVKYLPRDMRGKATRISLKRFRPVSTGYRLIAHTTLGGATCPGSCDVGRCPRCGWVNPAAYVTAGETPAPTKGERQ